MKNVLHKLLFITALAITNAAFAAVINTDDALQKVLQARLLNDRTGVCMAVAVISDTTIKAIACANPNVRRAIDDQTAFEIGSITKTMTATLLASMIQSGQMSLDAPLADYLPSGTQVPSFKGKPILLRHVVTHTSGLGALPPDFAPTDASNPYANLTEKSLLASLAKVELKQAPGEVQSYSNFAMMVLSIAIANKAGKSYEDLLKTRIFLPLGMDGAYISDSNRPKRITAAVGHLPNQAVTSPWIFPVNLAGVGGVRATLPDMIQYAKAQLGREFDKDAKINSNPAATANANANANAGLIKAIAKTQEVIPLTNGQPMGMNWFMRTNAGAEVLFHGGGTGGFSTEILIDKKAGRAVVVLADTSLTNLGGVSDVALHLLNPDNPIGEARIATEAPTGLLTALEGDYVLSGGLPMTLRIKDKALAGQAAGQSEFEFGYDSRGDFYPLAFDAALRPEKLSTGYRFIWLQGGGAQIAKRMAPKGEKLVAVAVSDKELERYIGTYNLAPNFDIKFFVESGKFYAQATHQPKFLMTALGGTKFILEAVPAEIEFLAGDGVTIDAVELLQNGRKNKARKVAK